MCPNLIGDGRDQVSSAWSKLLKPGVDCCMSRVQTSRLPAGCSRLMQFQRVEQSTGVPVSRLMFVPRLKQSTGLTGQSTGRSYRATGRVRDGHELLEINLETRAIIANCIPTDM